MSKYAVVVTTIQSPTKAVTDVAKKLGKTFDFVIIGDRKSPPDFYVEHADYYGMEEQKRMAHALGKVLPENHYARKNIGYLVAAQRGAELILETDDDNRPLQDFGDNLRNEVEGELFTAPECHGVLRVIRT